LRHAELAERSFVVRLVRQDLSLHRLESRLLRRAARTFAEFAKCTSTSRSARSRRRNGRSRKSWRKIRSIISITCVLSGEARSFPRRLAGSRFNPLPVGARTFPGRRLFGARRRDDLAFCEWLVKKPAVAAIQFSAFYESPPSDQRLIRFWLRQERCHLEQAAERLHAL